MPQRVVTAEDVADWEPGPNTRTLFVGEDEWPNPGYGALKDKAHHVYRSNPIEVVTHDYLGFSDYSGGTVERANVKVWREDFADSEDEIWGVAHGGHGTTQIIIRRDRITPEMIETLDALEEYPAIRDDAVSEVEMEEGDRAWDDYGRRDLRKTIEKRFDIELDDVTDEQIDEMWYEMRDKLNLEGGSGVIFETGGQAYFLVDDRSLFSPAWQAEKTERFLAPWLEQWGFEVEEK